MSAPRLSIGTFGDIGLFHTAGGRVVARVRYRDWDGRTRLVQAGAAVRGAFRTDAKVAAVS